MADGGSVAGMSSIYQRRGPAYRTKGVPRIQLSDKIHHDLFQQLMAYAAQEGLSRVAALERALAAGLAAEAETRTQRKERDR